MELETINDVLSWTRDFHKHLSTSLNHGADRQQGERTKLLMSYLADHERQLEKIVADFHQQAASNVLDTWCVEYGKKHSVASHDQRGETLAEMNAEQVVSHVMREHDDVIELYRYLVGRAPTREAGELLQELLDLEQHEAMRMMQSSNRWSDI